MANAGEAEAERECAVRVVERWNLALAAGNGVLWSAVARRLLSGVPHIVEAMSRQRPAAMLVTSSPFYFTLAKQIEALATRDGVPAIYQREKYAEAGGDPAVVTIAWPFRTRSQIPPSFDHA
jgi:hypothetical protein